MMQCTNIVHCSICRGSEKCLANRIMTRFCESLRTKWAFSLCLMSRCTTTITNNAITLPLISLLRFYVKRMISTREWDLFTFGALPILLHHDNKKTCLRRPFVSVCLNDSQIILSSIVRILQVKLSLLDELHHEISMRCKS